MGIRFLESVRLARVPYGIYGERWRLQRVFADASLSHENLLAREEEHRSPKGCKNDAQFASTGEMLRSPSHVTL